MRREIHKFCADHVQYHRREIHLILIRLSGLLGEPIDKLREYKVSHIISLNTKLIHGRIIPGELSIGIIVEK